MDGMGMKTSAMDIAVYVTTAMNATTSNMTKLTNRREMKSYLISRLYETQ